MSLHGKNLTDKRYRTAGYCFGYGADSDNPECSSVLGGGGETNNITAFYGPPRTWTTTVEYRF